MFKPDQAIKKKDEDFLNRESFVNSFSNVLADWTNEESLVIALNGKWGVGKTSVINLVKESLESKKRKGNQEKKDNLPTIIQFNPWEFSNSDISNKFFNEISAQLQLKNEGKGDLSLAKLLEKYATLLDILPSAKSTTDVYQLFLILIGFMGIAIDKITPSSFSKDVSSILFVVSIILLAMGFIKTVLEGLSAFFKVVASNKSRTIDEVKASIGEKLLSRKQKLLILIDDIDRLTPKEMNEVFRLIRANANFPNTIYLLAYDKEVVEKSISSHLKLNGKEYLEKIVQVHLDLPLRHQHKIHEYLFSELDRILSLLPEKSSKYFDKDSYWANIYNSGFKDYFATIRDIKRYINGLEFSIKQLVHNDTLEVNPVDFFALEAVRIFASEFYNFLKYEKYLFTTTASDYPSSNSKLPDERKQKIAEAFKKVPIAYIENTKKLVFELFPQVKGNVDGFGNTSYGHEWQETWEQDLRICATNCFDQYFTLIPGGDEGEISQFEIESICSLANNQENFEIEIRKFIDNKRIRKLLKKLLSFTSNTTLIPITNYENIILTLFNVSDILPEVEESMWDFGIDMDLQRVIFSLLKNTKDKIENNKLIAKLIPLSQGIIGPIRFVSLETPKEDEKLDESKFVLDTSKIEELQKLSVEILGKTDFDKLLNHKDLSYILYRWKNWGDSASLSKFLKKSLQQGNILQIIKAFISTTKSKGMSDYGYNKTDHFIKKSFEVFYDYDEVKKKVQKLKNLDEESKEIVHLFLNPEKDDLRA